MYYKNKTQKVLEQMDVGKIGEIFFIKHIFPNIKHFKNKKIVDLRGTKLEKNKDIDFLIVPNDYHVDVENLDWQENVINELSYHTENNLSDSNIFAIEIKTDKKANIANNLVYDITSHDKPGGCARTICDFLFYVVLDENNNIIKHLNINMFKLRRFLRENCKNINKIKGLSLLNMQDEQNINDGNSLLLLVNFNLLNNIAKTYEVNGTL